MNRRAAVFGAAGQLGAELVRELNERGYSVIGWDRNQVDITDGAAVESALASYEAEVAFNCAAYNQVDVAEKEPQAAFLVNALAVRNLALACRQVDARLVHFSTDYVFDGFAHYPYAEDDPTHPLGAYAVSKLAGELYAQAYLDRPLVVRTSGVFGLGGCGSSHSAGETGTFAFVSLRGGASDCRHFAKFIAEKVLGPILDVAKQVNIEGYQRRSFFSHLAKIEGGVVWHESFVGDTALQAPKEVLAVALQNNLDATVLRGINEHVR